MKFQNQMLFSKFCNHAKAICNTPSIGYPTDECIFEFGNAESTTITRNAFSFNFNANQTAIIDAISPKTGGSMGGTLVTISGSNFAVGDQTVMIGSSACDIKSESSTEIVCETNSHPTSTKHRVEVESSNGLASAADGKGSVKCLIDDI